MAKEQDRPNIVVIFGDDIGMWNVGLYTHGLMGWTPSVDSIGRDGRLLTDHYDPPPRAPRLHHGTDAGPPRHDHDRHPLIATRNTEVGSHAGGGAQVGRLYHRPVRQEPPRRSQRVPTDGARLRRVVRQPLSPERRGG